VPCPGIGSFECGDRLYPGEQCLFCYSRRYESHWNPKYLDLPADEYDEWLLILRQDKKDSFVRYCAKVAARTAAFAAHQAFGYALEAKGCVLSVRNICYEHYLDQFGARAATEIANHLCRGAGIHYKDFAPLFETE